MSIHKVNKYSYSLNHHPPWYKNSRLNISPPLTEYKLVLFWREYIYVDSMNQSEFFFCSTSYPLMQGSQKKHKMKSLSNTITQDTQWDSNLRFLDLEFTALPTMQHAGDQSSSPSRSTSPKFSVPWQFGSCLKWRSWANKPWWEGWLVVWKMNIIILDHNNHAYALRLFYKSAYLI